MKIKTFNRLCPFSHLSGTKFPIPFSNHGVQIFHSALILFPENRWIPLNVTGPITEFTAVLDLEKGVIKVFGKSKEGYFRYFLFSDEDKLYLYQDKGNGVLFSDPFFLLAKKLPQPKIFEKLSLGISKTLDLELVKRRLDLKELLPVWFLLGQMIPKISKQISGDSLLKELIESSGLKTEGDFLNLFQAGFSGVFYPEAVDSLYLGYSHAPIPLSENPFLSLTEGYKKIRSLIALEEENSCFILPSALLHFPCGRVSGLKTSFGTIDIEWTKNHLRQIHIYCKNSALISFKFPKNHKSCRLNSSNDLNLFLDLNCTLDLRAGTQYFLSHFQE